MSAISPRHRVQGSLSTTSRTDNDVLRGVTCTSVRLCVAVGDYSPGTAVSGSQPLVEVWDGTAWSVMKPAPTSANDADFLYGISCVPARFCAAAGYYFGPTVGFPKPLVELWEGGAWSPVTPPPTSANDQHLLTSVSCTSARFCVAAGYYSGNSGTGPLEPLVESWNGSVWSMATPPLPTGSSTGLLTSVSCTSGRFCVAVGPGPLVEMWDGSAWSPMAPSPTSTSDDDWLSGVSCTSVRRCVGAGYYWGATTGGYPHIVPLAEHWDGRTWSIAKPPPTSTSDSDTIKSVACASPRFCVAAGDYSGSTTGGALQPFAEVWSPNWRTGLTHAAST